MKYSENFEKDYNYYLECIKTNKFSFSGIIIENKYNKIKFSANGKSPKECFYNIDTFGKFCDCNDLNFLYKLLNVKSSINLHIKMYADEISEYTTFKDYFSGRVELVDIIKCLLEEQFPEWVYKAIKKQSEKLFKLKNSENIYYTEQKYNNDLKIFSDDLWRVGEENWTKIEELFTQRYN